VPLITAEAIALAIRVERDEYIERGLATSAYRINDGLCEDFAQDVIDTLTGRGETDELGMAWHDNYQREDVWDRQLLQGLLIFPPYGLSWAELDAVHFGAHAFIVHTTPEGVSFYDAECPEGVRNFFYLPLFQRAWEAKYGRLLV